MTDRPGNVLPLVYEGDPRLHTPPPACQWEHPSERGYTTAERLERHFNDLVATMFDAGGVGLAATQVGIDLRIAVVLDVASTLPVPRKGKQPKKPKTVRVWWLINPTLDEFEGTEEGPEGCLSLPGRSAMRTRAAKAVCHTLEPNGGYAAPLRGEGYQARILQHEVDHLEGRLYEDPDRRDVG